MMIRIILFCVLTVLGLAGPVWLFVPALLVYMFLYTSVEVVLLAAFIDAYYGYGSSLPYLYTLSTGGVLLLIHILRPHFLVYNR